MGRDVSHRSDGISRSENGLHAIEDSGSVIMAIGRQMMTPI